MKGVIYQQNHFLMFYLIFCCSFVIHNAINPSSTTSSSIIRCLPHQNSALLQLKREFAFENLTFVDQFGYDVPSHPKMKFWKAGKDCCEWHGVTCNKETGQVVKLDLSNSGLQGPLLPNSSLFELHQLRRLNLALNNFTFSQIPSTFGRLSRLTHLNLSHSLFSGRVPYEIAWLTNLVSLDLSSNIVGLYLTMTTLAQNLTNLRELHLNSVNLSSSPPQFLENLSSLTSLSLSDCNLHGEFPKDIFRLPNITFIDASLNGNLTGSLPEFHSGSNLKSLIVSHTEFSGTLPDSIGNLQSLNVLDLSSCDFSGAIPSSVGKLSHLTTLYLSMNNFVSQLPSALGNLSQLAALDLSENNFNGQLPSKLGNLSQLTTLDFSQNNFTGQLPSTLKNLVKLTALRIVDTQLTGELPSSLGDLTRLERLSIGGNRFNGQIPCSIGNLSRLINLNISGERFDGKLPISLTNITKLDYLIMSDTLLSGAVPSSLFSMRNVREIWLENNQFTGPMEIQNISSSKLRYLSLRGNNINGQIPSSISKLKNLTSLSLESNDLSGVLELDMIFPEQSNVRHVHLSNNRDMSIKITGTSSSLPKFYSLGFSSCNIGKKFPDFLRTQDELISLDISNNKIEGKIPSWFFNVGIETLQVLKLSHNSFRGWEKDPNITLPWKNLRVLDLRSNMLQGPLVVPPLSIQYFFASENKLTGKVHSLFCNLSELVLLDVSNNLLNDTIPQCLGSYSSNLLVLNMRGNDFHGKIPHMCLDGSNLETLDLSRNKLEGKVPQSLINCSALEVLNLGHNQINDVFPTWIQNLPELQVLVLRSNKFHGPIWLKYLGFPKLRILDISFNNFNESLSPEFFRNWSAIDAEIRSSNNSELKYMKDDNDYYQDSVTLTVKGLEICFGKILTIFTSIDFSNNNFDGEIPGTIGDLKSLIVLNLSSNNFEGLIPSSLGNVTELESLDLSNNKLSGRIPQELVSLTFLGYLNLSDNQLTGPIPHGRQFDTFSNSSFESNLDLCGSPLSNKCSSTTDGTLSPDLDQSQESESENGFGWKAVLVGYCCGFLVGAIGGCVLFAKKPIWFLKIYGIKM